MLLAPLPGPRDTPAANGEWWRAKLDLNVARDRRNDASFAAAGWQVIRIWEHVPLVDAADRVCEAIARAQRKQRPTSPAA